MQPAYTNATELPQTSVDEGRPDAARGPSGAATDPTVQRTRQQCSWLQSDPWKNADQHSLASDGSHWAVCGDLLVRYDTEMVMAWKTDIQNQLVVVGRRPLCERSLKDVGNSQAYSLRSQPPLRFKFKVMQWNSQQLRSFRSSSCRATKALSCLQELFHSWERHHLPLPPTHGLSNFCST